MHTPNNDPIATIEHELPIKIQTRCGVIPECRCNCRSLEETPIIIVVRFQKNTIEHTIKSVGKYRDLDGMIQSVADRVAEIIKRQSRAESRKNRPRPGCRNFKHNGGRCCAGKRF